MKGQKKQAGVSREAVERAPETRPGERDFFAWLQEVTEKVLTARRRRIRRQREKEKAKNRLLDWLESFLWAAGVVLLVNQYLFQAYVIPSGSMIDTLLIGDRIFVNKIIFGPELLPGFGKLPSPFKPARNDVIIFENPSYVSRGMVFDIAQRVIYMVTLSVVNIDKNEAGEPEVHFLIKRAAALGGDTVASDARGRLRIRFAGETRWVDETAYLEERGWDHNLTRLMDEDAYPALRAAGKAQALADLGLSVPASLQAQAAPVRNLDYPDYLAYERAYLEVWRAARPQDGNYQARLTRSVQGWYVPESRVLPLGDNRDNSRDGRYFGPVKSSDILGKGALIYWSWPDLGRVGPIR